MRIAISLSLVVVLSSCQPTGQVEVPGRQLTVRQPIEAAGRTRQLGQDCSLNGQSICDTGLCVHVGQPPDDQFLCTVRCKTDSDCPVNWWCSKLFEDQAICIPGSGKWSGEPTVPRPPAPVRSRGQQ